jgi:hypothetical protein
VWQVDNRTPFAAERAWVRDRNGAEIWVVAVKATFDIMPDGGLEVAKEQPPVMQVPEHQGEAGKSSVKYDTDLVLTKKTTDVILVGHAYAPEGRAVTHTDVGFKVGSIQKVLRVFGDRTWGGTGATPPAPFETMPLVYERAFGGVDARSDNPNKDWEWRNPVGTGFAVSGRNATGLRLPNIEDPKNLISSWADRPPPAGFGAIASHWQPRVRFAGTYDEHWMKNRKPLLAEDLDDRYFQCAPADQQATEFLRGNEPVVLHRLTRCGRLTFSLPKVYLGFETHFYDGHREVHKNRKLHSVILEPDCPRVSLVWHSALPCHFKVQKLDHTVITLKAALNIGQTMADDAEPELD